MSSINPNNINGQYPVAGQDNDSQGFRDNFTNIKNNFTFAFNEITDLQNKAVLKSALSGGSISNDMSYAQLISPQLIKAVETINTIGTKTTDFSINWAEGHYQTVTINNNLAITGFTNFPAANYWTKLRLEMTISTSERIVTFPSAVSIGLDSIKGYQGNRQVRLPVGTYLLEFTTDDQGTTVVVRDLLRNYRNFDTDIQQYYPTGNVAFAANVGTNRVLVTPTPSGGITSFFVDVTLPNANVISDGTTVAISSNVAINELRALGSWLTTVSPSTNIAVAAGSSVTYLYRSADNKWYRT